MLAIIFINLIKDSQCWDYLQNYWIIMRLLEFWAAWWTKHKVGILCGHFAIL